MTRIQIIARRALLAAGATLLFLFLTILFIPSSEILSLTSRVLSTYAITFSAKKISKSFPLGIKCSDVMIAGEKGQLLHLDNLKISLNTLSLFAGRLLISCEARIGNGTLVSEFELTRKRSLTLSVSDLKLEDIPFFSSVAGAQAKGELMVKGSIDGIGKKPEGTLKMEVKSPDIRGVKIGEMPLPDASYRKMQGMLRFSKGVATLESVSIEGDSLFVRLSGYIQAGLPPAATPLNLSLELMPKPDFLEKQKFIFLLMVKYLDTPGHYLIPIKGTLAKPGLQ